jgi:hypothetical protein
MAQAVRQATANAFIHGLSISCLAAGGVAAGGALLAALVLPTHPGKKQTHAKAKTLAPVATAATANLIDPGRRDGVAQTDGSFWS